MMIHKSALNLQMNSLKPYHHSGPFILNSHFLLPPKVMIKPEEICTKSKSTKSSTTKQAFKMLLRHSQIHHSKLIAIQRAPPHAMQLQPSYPRRKRNKL